MILGSKLPVVHFVFLSDSSVHKTPRVKVVEIVSEQSRLLELFLSKSVQGHARMTKVQTASISEVV